MSSKQNSLQIIGQQPIRPTAGQDHFADPANFLGRVAVVTLGCAKNHVDSEVMVGALATSGYDLVDDVQEADIAIVNTCGFLQSAIEEGIDTILDISQLKQERLKSLIVAGCMVERYGEDLPDTLPEVDHFLTTNDLLSVVQSAGGEFHSILDKGSRPYFLYDDTMPRYIGNNAHSAYVKISEGCNRPCSFCIIPQIRGKMRSRKIDSVINEINNLHEAGVQEVNLVAQDLTDFGSDQQPKVTFTELIREIDRSTSIPWVRLFYAYPLGISEELINTIASSKRIVPYLDIPFQHASDELLLSMKRPRGKFSPLSIARLIRNLAPQIALRTTFIVGYPREEERHIDELADFLHEISFEHVGIFEYSAEQGTPAGELQSQVAEEVKSARKERLMLIQKDIVESNLSKYIGKTERVLFEGRHPESDVLFKGRAIWQGPEVDGVVIINDFKESLDIDSETLAGSFAQVLFTEQVGYDLVGAVVASSS